MTCYAAVVCLIQVLGPYSSKWTAASSEALGIRHHGHPRSSSPNPPPVLHLVRLLAPRELRMRHRATWWNHPPPRPPPFSYAPKGGQKFPRSSSFCAHGLIRASDDPSSIEIGVCCPSTHRRLGARSSVGLRTATPSLCFGTETCGLCGKELCAVRQCISLLMGQTVPLA